MEMDNLLLVGGSIVAIILIIRFIAKLLFKVVGLGIVAVFAAGYMYFYTDYFETHDDNLIVKTVGEKIKDTTNKWNVKSLKEFEKKFCEDGKTENDAIKCKCIIIPIVEDLNAKFTDEELKELYKDKSAYLKELLASITRNQSKIKRLLEENNASHLWNKTVKNLQKGQFL